MKNQTSNLTGRPHYLRKSHCEKRKKQSQPQCDNLEPPKRHTAKQWFNLLNTASKLREKCLGVLETCTQKELLRKEEDPNSGEDIEIQWYYQRGQTYAEILLRDPKATCKASPITPRAIQLYRAFLSGVARTALSEAQLQEDIERAEALEKKQAINYPNGADRTRAAKRTK